MSTTAMSARMRRLRDIELHVPRYTAVDPGEIALDLSDHALLDPYGAARRSEVDFDSVKGGKGHVLKVRVVGGEAVFGCGIGRDDEIVASRTTSRRRVSCEGRSGRVVNRLPDPKDYLACLRASRKRVVNARVHREVDDEGRSSQLQCEPEVDDRAGTGSLGTNRALRGSRIKIQDSRSKTQETELPYIK